MSEPAKTVAAIVKAATDYLAGRRVENPDLAAEFLAARLLRCKRLDLHLKGSTVLNDKLLDAMRRGIKRVADGEPLQYVLGEWDFMGHTLAVDKRALIPRPETELLVTQVLDCADLWKANEGRPRIVELGTGSGCIIISLALARANAVYLSLDVSPDALALATENATRLGVETRVAFSDAELCDLVEPNSVDALVANLPYIPSGECDRLPAHIRDHEPRLALDGGPDGLDIIRMAVEDAAMALAPDGRIFLEMGAGQGSAVRGILEDCGFLDVRIIPDLAGHDRMALARMESLE